MAKRQGWLDFMREELGLGEEGVLRVCGNFLRSMLLFLVLRRRRAQRRPGACPPGGPSNAAHENCLLACLRPSPYLRPVCLPPAPPRQVILWAPDTLGRSLDRLRHNVGVMRGLGMSQEQLRR